MGSLGPNTRLQRGIAFLTIGLVLAVMTVGMGVAGASGSLGAVGSSNDTTLVGVQGDGVTWATGGEIVAVRNSTATTIDAGVDSYFDVTKLEGDRVVAAFAHNGYRDCGRYEPPCTRTGYRVIDRDSSRVVEQYSYPVRTARNSEVHDVEPLRSGGYLLTDMEHERIVVVRNGSVAWQWNASSFYDAPPDPTTTDWLHINDVDVIDEGRYLVSVRNANQLLVIERGAGVVEVVNGDTSDANEASCRTSGQLADHDGDGDVRCGDPTVLHHQHNPQWLGNDTVLVADSENNRVVQLHERSNGTWTPEWTLHSANGGAFFWPRDADRLPNGNTLITDTLNRRIVEVTPSGRVVWSVRTDGVPYEADRIPPGEPADGVRYQQATTGPQNVNDDVPVLSTMLRGLRIVHPDAPIWFTEVELLGMLCAVLFAVRGGLDVVRSRRG